eukprot:26513-Alexandrium_andersonii.AAC.1
MASGSCALCRWGNLWCSCLWPRRFDPPLLGKAALAQSAATVANGGGAPGASGQCAAALF